MLVLGLSKAKNAIAAVWRAINGDTRIDRCDNSHERAPLQRSELSDIFAIKFKQSGAAEFTKREQREHDTMFTLREILHD
ncbi:MAG: hypothetical protein KC448_10715 [Yoonia sp.]|nr:hypothetical protein [Yoonia sp.]